MIRFVAFLLAALVAAPALAQRIPPPHPSYNPGVRPLPPVGHPGIGRPGFGHPGVVRPGLPPANVYRGGGYGYRGGYRGDNVGAAIGGAILGFGIGALLARPPVYDYPPPAYGPAEYGPPPGYYPAPPAYVETPVYRDRVYPGSPDCPVRYRKVWSDAARTWINVPYFPCR